MSTINEFILIFTFKRHEMRSDDFGDNLNTAKFNKLKRCLNIKPEQEFPAGEKEKPWDDRVVSEHLTTCRKANKDQYVVAGCSQGDYAMAIINIKCLKVVRPIVQFRDTIQNFIMYRDIMLIADMRNKLMITGVDNNKKNRIEIDSYTLAKNSHANRGFENCGMHMEIDGCMAYLLCNDNQLVRFDLKNIDATNPYSTTDKLEIKVIYQTKIMPCYYISKRYIHVMAEHQ